MQDSRANVTIEVVPSKTFLISGKDRKTLVRHVSFLRKLVKDFRGEVVWEADYVDEVMMVFKFTDFDCCQAFAEVVQNEGRQ